MPKVSICIPTYNQTEHLSKTLDSILIQTFHDYEIIITDDSSSEIVSDFIKNYDFNGKLKYFHNEIPLGSPKNWNYCISKAKGDLIKIVHHDDWFCNDYSLARYVAPFENPNVHFAFSSSHVLLENGQNWVHLISEQKLNILKNYPAVLFLGNSIGGPSAVIFRKNNNIFDENLKWLVDIDFYIDSLIVNNHIAYLQEPLITTFAAKGRISDYCHDNKEIEIYEYFYLKGKINSIYSKNSLINRHCLYHLLVVCEKYGVTSISEIRNCGYLGKIETSIRLYIFINRFFRNTRLTNFYKSLLVKLSPTSNLNQK